MTKTSRRWRIAATGAAVGLVLPLGAVGQPAIAAAPSTAQAIAEKAEQKITAEIEEKGKTDFWVFLDSQADLSAAEALTVKAEKAAAVYQAKTQHAEESQAGLRGLLTAQGADFRPFWIANTIKVTGDAELLGEIAIREDVSQILADQPVALPQPQPAAALTAVDGVEWNIDRVDAPRVWNELGVRGEGIVVANIDTGVNYTHPAVAASYRGKKADGSYDHNYNWFDPAGVCGTAAPCDNNDHGTHTMGTMVGLDGDNIIGVAPGAQWVAVKGCESSSCSRDSLLAAGQWVVAPTDLDGENPRPDLAPDIVNNSWGGSGFDPWYKETVTAWVAAGIFPAFSNGNSGSSCNTSGSPGTYSISYSSGAFDSNNTIASFSSRGAGEGGDIKPNIAAPGVSVRSATRTGYGSFSGTSMASPHTAATVALMWSASPAIYGDIDATRAILDDTAVDTPSSQCGGTDDDNNVYGEGRLDAYAAVYGTPRGALGTLNGHITSGGAALAGATVAVAGPMGRSTSSSPDGSYAFDRLMVGDYTITVTKFGYLTATGTATITENQTSTVDIAIQQAPSATLSGTVSTSAGPAGGASVTVLGTPLSATADAAGNYSVVVPQGAYDVRAEHAYRCADPATTHVAVTGDTTLNITLPDRTDDFGYACGAAGGDFIKGVDLVEEATGDDRAVAIDLPFGVPFYGRNHRAGWVSTNGLFGFGPTSTSYSNTELPRTANPNLVLYPFWDDLFVEADSGIYTTTIGAKPHRAFVVEWRNIAIRSDRSMRLTFSATISEDGSIVFRYKDINGTGAETGTSATIGLENATGTDGFQYSYNSSEVSDGMALGFRTTRTGVASGVVTDANDGQPVAGATVTARVGTVEITETTGEDGSYAAQVPVGDVQLTMGKEHYEAVDGVLSVAAGAVAERSASLRTARVGASANALTVIAAANQSRTRQVTLENTGGLGTDFTVSELNAAGEPSDVSWMSLSGTTGTLQANGGRSNLGLALSTDGLTPGTYHQAKLQISSASGRSPVLIVPVTLVVPSYVLALDAGAKGGHVDIEGESWTPDQAYTPGGAGYLGNSKVSSTNTLIAGTDDQSRLADQRENMYEYRFDGLATGTYTIELDFAELRSMAADKRVFDVLVEGQEVLPSLDIAGAVGSYTALKKTFTVQVTDGQLNVRFVTHKGHGLPVINALRVTNRPDLVS